MSDHDNLKIPKDKSESRRLTKEIKNQESYEAMGRIVDVLGFFPF